MHTIHGNIRTNSYNIDMGSNVGYTTLGSNHTIHGSITFTTDGSIIDTTPGPSGQAPGPWAPWAQVPGHTLKGAAILQLVVLLISVLVFLLVVVVIQLLLVVLPPLVIQVPLVLLVPAVPALRAVAPQQRSCCWWWNYWN